MITEKNMADRIRRRLYKIGHTLHKDRATGMYSIHEPVWCGTMADLWEHCPKFEIAERQRFVESRAARLVEPEPDTEIVLRIPPHADSVRVDDDVQKEPVLIRGEWWPA